MSFTTTGRAPSAWRGRAVSSGTVEHPDVEEDTMGARAEALAKQFETKAQEATTVIERLSDADWKKATGAEKWPIGVVAHHMAGGHETIAEDRKSTRLNSSH